MNFVRRTQFLIFLLFLILGCSNSNTVKVVVDDINSTCDTSCFRGIKADFYYKDLVATVGKPNEIYEEELSDEDDYYNPIYYFGEGKIMCYWNGKKKHPIGLIEYTPYLNSNIRVGDFIKNYINENRKKCIF